MLINYKNESSINVSKYYMLAIYLANTKHFCEILKNIQYEFMLGYSTNLWLEKMWFSNVKHSYSQIFLKTQRLDGS